MTEEAFQIVRNVKLLYDDRAGDGYGPTRASRGCERMHLQGMIALLE